MRIFLFELLMKCWITEDFPVYESPSISTFGIRSPIETEE